MATAPAPMRKPVVKVRLSWADRAVKWMPWILTGLALILNALRDYGFDGTLATGWILVGWAVGRMIGLTRQYPFKGFEPSTAIPSNADGATPVRGLPVQLEGQVVLDETDPKKRSFLFSDASGTVPLNRWAKFDILGGLFGVTGLQTFTAAPATIRGWYRKTGEPFVEIRDIRGAGKRRGSLARLSRWAAAGFFLLVGLVILLTTD